MIATNRLHKTLVEFGYKAADVYDGYQFAAVDQPDLPVRQTAVAAFFDSPPSYRNAALGIVQVPAETSVESAVEAQRSLGAPFLIAISEKSVSAWSFTSRGPSKFDEAPVSEWANFSAKHSGIWRADAVRRAKAIHLRVARPSQQLLFDPATLFTIQTQVQSALDSLLRSFISYFESVPNRSALSLHNDYRVLFPLVFRLLAAKILYDREDRRLATVDPKNIEDVIDAISKLYSLAPLPIRWNVTTRAQLSDAWKTLLHGLHVRNIAADDLAFVYENVLITKETRKAFGTHSTPSAIAEYVVRSFNLPNDVNVESLRVYEPFAGSCVFLTAAMRRFKEMLPAEWSPSKMHKHLVSRFAASEIDQFACEIARLSLILADYPNANGWHINNEDLFEGQVLTNRLASADMVICNPPFEDFDDINGYGSAHKPVVALTSILERSPAYLGIVMPPGFGSHKKYRDLAKNVVAQYQDVELLELPEGTFRRASVSAVVLIAQDPRTTSTTSLTTVRKSTVHRTQRQTFEQTLQPSTTESIQIHPVQAPGFTGLTPLRDIWEYLGQNPRLGDLADVHRGLEWRGDQRLASSSRAEKGYRRGLHRIAESLAQFRILRTTYLNCREEALRGGAIQHRWQNPKIVCSAIRVSRGPWRLAACVDERGLVVSQQFFGIWLREGVHSELMLPPLAAILNSPVANAFSYIHDPEKGLRIETMKQLPLPTQEVAREVNALVEEYVSNAEQAGPLFHSSNRTLADILMEIDAKILAAYDLPPKLEKALLKFMNEGERPCQHSFGPYPGANESGAIPLKRLLAREAAAPSVKLAWEQLLVPLPAEVADVFDAV